MTQNGDHQHDSTSSSERYGNKWYDYQNQLKKRYGPGADLLIRMGYVRAGRRRSETISSLNFQVPNAEDHTVHANPNHGRRGLGYSTANQEGPIFRRGHGSRDSSQGGLRMFSRC